MKELIQDSFFSLSLQQQKIVSYLISQIMPYDEDFKLYEFSIQEFCGVCGIDENSMGNYQSLKDAIKEIRDKRIDNGRQTPLYWIEKSYIDYKREVVKIRLDNDMKPFLLQLQHNFTNRGDIFESDCDCKPEGRHREDNNGGGAELLGR